MKRFIRTAFEIYDMQDKDFNVNETESYYLLTKESNDSWFGKETIKHTILKKQIKVQSDKMTDLVQVGDLVKSASGDYTLIKDKTKLPRNITMILIPKGYDFVCVAHLVKNEWWVSL